MYALSDLIRSAQTAIASAADLAVLDQARVLYLGKKGTLTERLKELGRLPPEQRLSLIHIWNAKGGLPPGFFRLKGSSKSSTRFQKSSEISG